MLIPKTKNWNEWGTLKRKKYFFSVDDNFSSYTPILKDNQEVRWIINTGNSFFIIYSLF